MNGIATPIVLVLFVLAIGIAELPRSVRGRKLNLLGVLLVSGASLLVSCGILAKPTPTAAPMLGPTILVITLLAVLGVIAAIAFVVTFALWLNKKDKRKHLGLAFAAVAFLVLAGVFLFLGYDLNVKTGSLDKLFSGTLGAPVAQATTALPPVATAAPKEPVSTRVPSSAGSKAASTGMWKVTFFPGATDLMKDFVFTDPDPTWEKFPNEDWPQGNFKASNGLEYGQWLSAFCQQDQRCDFNVAARSYRYFSGDWAIDGLGACKAGSDRIGCALAVFNVGDVTAMWRNAHLDYGFTVTGLYWNGDENDQAISALMSWAAYRMIGPVKDMPANPGANCSVPEGCLGVHETFIITSGNQVLVKGVTTVSR